MATLTEAEELELLELEEDEARSQESAIPNPQNNAQPQPTQESPGFWESTFPSTKEALKTVGGVGGSERLGMGLINDVSGLPNRVEAAAFTDQKMSDPEAYPLKDFVDEAYEGKTGVPYLPPKPIVEFAARAVTDPTMYAGVFTKGAQAIKAGGEALKDAGVNVLRRAIKPSRPSMRAWNAPNFEVPLERGLVPKFGGLEKTGQNIQKAVETTADEKDAILAAAKIRLNGAGSINEARRSIIGGIGKGSGLSAVEVKDVPKYMDEAFETAKNYPSFKGNKNAWSVSGQDAVEFRKWMDKQTSFDKAKDLPVRAEFYRKLRRAFEDQIDTRMGQKNVAERTGFTGQTDYAGAKGELAELMPIKKAFEERLLQDPNNYALGLREMTLLGGAVASGNLGAATAKAGIGVAINRLLNRPGGAAILYDIGQRMETAGPMKSLLLKAGETGKISSVANRIMDALAITKDEAKKKILEKRLESELNSEAKKQ